MKPHGAMVMIAAVGILTGCAKPPAAAVMEVEMVPMQVGTKTPDYEVVSPTELQLASGVRIESVKDANGKDTGFVVMRDNSVGGFMSCGCIGATTSTCVTENDNPEHPSCGGGCTDSEGNTHGCQLTTNTGPPKDPFTLKYVAAKVRTNR
jgi:hypothetical protein